LTLWPARSRCFASTAPYRFIAILR
jgi:hypothetical protein